MLEIELPYPPSVNHYYRRVGPRTLISRQGRRYREHVCAILRALRVHPLRGHLEVWIDAYPPDRRRRDADNLLKSCLDSLQHGGLYRDDSQVKSLHVAMRPPVAGGKILVRAGEMANAED
ncbi:MAG: RusA family crossover junction endodeoxyribonuclease [Lentisphaerae bacterium]|jgi:crossover junction endodeoxyribonuclease RusA|nr:RusA family crossover junction endodeoxyribonuclease [Lentisphaerota bacterium]MBT5608566.1 RusA family crossover junction endodeoxyribonuclease [Lentisphaerota bacterium]